MTLYNYLKYFLLLFLVVTNCFSAIPTFSHFGIDQGLGDEYVKTITKDNYGYIWVGTTNGIYKYNGYHFSQLEPDIFLKNLTIKDLAYDNSNNLWIASENQGLFKVQNNKWQSIKNPANNSLLKIHSIYHDKATDTLWLASNDGVKKVIQNGSSLQISTIENTSKIIVSKIERLDENHLILGLRGEIRILNLINFDGPSYKIESYPDVSIYDLLITKDFIWIATSESLLKFNTKNHSFKEVIELDTAIRFRSLVSNSEFVFASSIINGLYQINIQTNKVTHYIKSDLSKHSIIESSIESLFLDQDVLFIGNFHKGMSTLKLKSLNFNFNNGTRDSIHCAQSDIFFSGLLDANKNLWLGNTNGLIKHSPKSNTCIKVKANKSIENTLTNHTNMLEINGNIWVGTYNGLIQVDSKSLEIISHFGKGIVFKEIFLHPVNKLLYFYNGGSNLFKIQEGEIIPINIEGVDKIGLKFTEVKITQNGKVYLATNKGILQLIDADLVTPLQHNPSNTLNNSISSFLVYEDGFLLATETNGLIETDMYGEIKNQYLEKDGLPKNTIINNIILASDSSVWISSFNGLFRLKNDKMHHFKNSDGTGNYYYYNNFAFSGEDDQLYFGGQNGFINFKPDSIKLNTTPPRIVLDNLSLLNVTIEPNKKYKSGFLINKPINDLDKIELSHKDYIIGFEFSALDYADPIRNQYAYRLKGFQDDWVHTDANNRQAIFTNLNPGNYTFQVKASNKDGVWSKIPKELKIKVHPAPWLSPWAFLTYFIITLFSIWAFIRYKTIASRIRAEKLEKIIKVRTQEVKMQKKMVESLLEHKNEVFANITHEFNTPLALILGPSEQLVNNPELMKFSEEHNMIQRNAKRLMLMVGQILKLSQAENNKEVILESQAVQPILLMLYESFNPLAQDKNIQLILDNDHDVNIYATSECLEIVMGNLISNALKFTNSGGKVIIRSEIQDAQVKIYVQDTGSGIQEKDRGKIFKRFTRLESHKNITGTGIGLSVVKEITTANDGQVDVQSTWGKGTTFTITFPTTIIKPDKEMSQVMVDQLVANTKNELAEEQTVVAINSKNNRITVLIIEDNLDMQKHIGKVLSNRFNCLFADRGKHGIAIALKELPDIIICDVMMPGMDGYQATRILRHDGRTSHIPIVLLTALNTTESRIKGWRENIDTYITKPFNGQELNVQLDNILTIRTILQKKTNIAFKSNKPLSNLELSKLDMKFIDKLSDVIGMVYANEYIQRADLADKMAVSESQLQRKVIALTGERPMIMLREYRLTRACMKLKDGYQVGLVSDECGFSSVSYFGSCFKKQYGVTPKQYQTLNKN